MQLGKVKVPSSFLPQLGLINEYGGERILTTRGGTCCQFVNADITVKKHWGQFAVGPSLIAPIYFTVNYHSAAFDKQFTFARNLWLSGWGFGLSGEYSLH